MTVLADTVSMVTVYLFCLRLSLGVANLSGLACRSRVVALAVVTPASLVLEGAGGLCCTAPFKFPVQIWCSRYKSGVGSTGLMKMCALDLPDTE